MVAWLLIAIASLTIFTFLAVNTISNVNSVNDIVGRTDTARRMDSAINGLLAQAASPNNTGTVWLPAGQSINGGTEYILPANLSQYGTNSAGQQLIYCPFGGGEAGTNLTVPSYNGSSYTVQTAALNGVNYVVGGRPAAYAQVAANPNLLGWLIAQRNRNDPIPSCNNVAFNAATNTFSVQNGIVRPIIRGNGAVQNREVTTRMFSWYVSPTGTGSGNSVNDPSSLFAAMDYWRLNQPGQMTINFANGTYTAPVGLFDITTGQFTDHFSNPTLYLKGTPGAVQINSPSSTNFYMTDGNYTINGINFDSNMNFVANGADGPVTFSFINATIRNVSGNSNGIINLTNTTINNSTSISSISLQSNSTLNITGNLNINDSGTGYGILLSSNTVMNANAANITISAAGSASGTYGIELLSGSALNATGSTFAFNGNLLIDVAAEQSSVNMESSTIAIGSTNQTTALYAMDGSKYTLNNTNMTGSVPTYGFYDNGASLLDGSNTTLRGSGGCWVRTYASNLLYFSTPTSAGNYSAVPSNANIGNLANNSGNTISNYIGGNNSINNQNPSGTSFGNSFLENLRANNKSNWLCSN